MKVSLEDTLYRLQSDLISEEGLIESSIRIQWSQYNKQWDVTWLDLVSGYESQLFSADNLDSVAKHLVSHLVLELDRNGVKS